MCAEDVDVLYGRDLSICANSFFEEDGVSVKEGVNECSGRADDWVSVFERGGCVFGACCWGRGMVDWWLGGRRGGGGFALAVGGWEGGGVKIGGVWVGVVVWCCVEGNCIWVVPIWWDGGGVSTHDGARWDVTATATGIVDSTWCSRGEMRQRGIQRQSARENDEK